MSRLYRSEEADVGTTARVKDLPCSAPGCDRNALLRSGGGPACNRHYQMWLRYAAFQAPPRDRAQTVFTCAHCSSSFERGYTVSRERASGRQYCNIECERAGKTARAEAGTPDRFWALVAVGEQNECWPWQGHKKPLGYGRFTNRPGDIQQAHRMAYRLAKGSFDERLFVCHACDNPSCCNPSHLWLGTHRQNMDDMFAKKRHSAPPVLRGERSLNARLTKSDVLQVVKSSEPDRALAARFGVTAAAIYNIRHGKAWSHVTGIKRHA